MKKNLLILSILFFLFKCFALNDTGLNPGHETGKEAAKRIREASILSDLITNSIMTNKPRVDVSSLLIDKIVKIQPNAYYRSKLINNCIKSFWGLPISAAFAAVSFACNFENKEDGILIDPFFFSNVPY